MAVWRWSLKAEFGWPKSISVCHSDKVPRLGRFRLSVRTRPSPETLIRAATRTRKAGRAKEI
ncbi:uncharacterized protein CIMG_05506 [Coccidioides immitis RS]|uniref:Uncharacterized protein n=3 Tax=Coccidioides immitis TaxID=5501 RepID=J3KFR0_COCIM|nr:uncharacterized protein CIMG_05506 [Coccidioides immitis RS]EAS34482.3 hypothetical protein CIMG_05506 [Coccidioides immitis RS]KMP05637.1 hypothetical protein CIRG_05318 [Coccidioides immitis RMSCC 2394]KMU74369.1 hypothetical protein CISG_04442 [Coccidioides immitis RMSCC 3703]